MDKEFDVKDYCLFYTAHCLYKVKKNIFKLAVYSVLIFKSQLTAGHFKFIPILFK